MSEYLLIHGDARKLPIDPGAIDAVITDLPYGVNFQGKNTKHTRRVNEGYNTSDDTEEYVRFVIVPIVGWLVSIVSRAVVFPGTRNLHWYPRPTEIGGVYSPSGAGRGPWGFTCFHPILYYGKDPHGPKGQSPNSFSTTVVAEDSGHPCPKPIAWMEWVIKKSTRPGELVLDPFMGSGTTGVACLKLGRRFIGLDLDRRYVQIAHRRITRPHSRPQRPERDEHHPLFDRS